MYTLAQKQENLLVFFQSRIALGAAISFVREAEYGRKETMQGESEAVDTRGQHTDGCYKLNISRNFDIKCTYAFRLASYIIFTE